MPKPRIVFDIETILDEEAVARAYKLPPETRTQCAPLSARTSRRPLSTGSSPSRQTALVYDIHAGAWSVPEMASLHVGDQTEKELVSNSSPTSTA